MERKNNDAQSARPAAIIFDLDDTLFDEIEFLHSSFRVIAATLAERYSGLSAKAMESVLFGAKGNAFDALREWLPAYVAEDQLWMRDLYRTHTPQIALRPHTALTLAELQRRGHPLGLITDGRVTTQRLKIEALGLDRWIAPEHILISEAVGADKTQLRPFELMQQLMPHSLEMVYVGDNPVKDIVNPQVLGWTTVQLADAGRNIHPQPLEPSPDLRIGQIDHLLNYW